MEVIVQVRLWVLSAAIILLSFQASADTIPFSYTLVNLGGGEYQYDYTIYNNGSLGAGVAVQLFDVDFDSALYSNLQIATPTALASQWTEQIFPAGGGLPADFDVSTPTNGGIAPLSSVSGFAVDFNYLGTGLPGSQPFTITNPTTFALLQSGNTINPVSLSLQGGTTSDPTSLPSGSLVGSVSETSGTGSQDYYSFLWAGGAFDVTASVTNGSPGGASYVLTYGVGGTGGTCSNLGNASLTNTGNGSFTGMVGNNTDLAAGQYCIGINASIADPNFTITFNTPVEGTATSVPAAPEPSTIALLFAGTGIIRLLRRSRAARKA